MADKLFKEYIDERPDETIANQTLVALNAAGDIVRVPIPDSLPASPLPPYLTIAAMLADQVSQIAGYVYIAAGRTYIKLTTNTANIADYVLVSGVGGSGTVGTLPVFSPDGTTLGNSRVKHIGNQGVQVNNAQIPSYGVSFFDDPNRWIRIFRNQSNFDLSLGNPDSSQENEINSGNYFGTRFNYDGFLRFVRVGNSGTFEALRLHTNGAAQFIRATLASITNAAAGFLIFDSGNSNRPTIHNGTSWKGLAYTDELGRLTPVNITTAQTIDITTATQGSSYNVSFASTFTLSSGNIGGTICSINNYLGSDFELQYNRTEVLVLGSDALKQIRIQPSTVDNGFTGVSIECMGVIGGKTAYKVYGNLTEV